MAIPIQDIPLVAWSSNADTRLTASPTTYGTTAAVATQFHTVHQAFIDAQNDVVAARAAGIRSESLTAIRDGAKQALLNFARPLYKQIQANVNVTPAAKIELGVKVPDVEPSPIPVPGTAPILRVDGVNGRVVRISLRDVSDPDRKRIPPGVNGAIVMSYVGTAAPTNPDLFRLEAPVSRTTMDVTFPDSLTPGTQVWLCALWFNEKKQMGPACTPVGAIINYGGSMPMAA